MKAILRYLLLLLSLHIVKFADADHSPAKEEDSAIYYEGFVNNETYQHYMPSKYPETLSDKDLITLTCNKGYTVLIKRAFIIDLNGEENDYTEMAKDICINKEYCSVNVRNFKRNTKNNALDHSTELNIEYICMSSEKPLFDGNNFHQGVTSKYLVLRDISKACAKSGEPVLEFGSIPKAMEACNLSNCTYVTWNNEKRKAFICKDDVENLNEKKGDVTYINPTFFHTNGYAVFLNYMSLCDSVIKSVPHNLSMFKSVDVCSHLECHYFTKSYEGTIKSLKNAKQGKTWFCKGFPTMIPMDGFVTSVNLNKHL